MPFLISYQPAGAGLSVAAAAGKQSGENIRDRMLADLFQRSFAQGMGVAARGAEISQAAGERRQTLAEPREAVAENYRQLFAETQRREGGAAEEVGLSPEQRFVVGQAAAGQRPTGAQLAAAGVETPAQQQVGQIRDLQIEKLQQELAGGGVDPTSKQREFRSQSEWAVQNASPESIAATINPFHDPGYQPVGLEEDPRQNATAALRTEQIGRSFDRLAGQPFDQEAGYTYSWLNQRVAELLSGGVHPEALQPLLGRIQQEDVNAAVVSQQAYASVRRELAALEAAGQLNEQIVASKLEPFIGPVIAQRGLTLQEFQVAAHFGYQAAQLAKQLGRDPGFEQWMEMRFADQLDTEQEPER
jgi:hypothetical protein